MHGIFKEVHRMVVIVRPRQPFVDWINTLPGHRTQSYGIEEFQEDCTALLVPDFEDETEIDEHLGRFMIRILEYELESWHMDSALWPTDRSLNTAREWLEFEWHSEVFDTTRTGAGTGKLAKRKGIR